MSPPYSNKYRFVRNNSFARYARRCTRSHVKIHVCTDVRTSAANSILQYRCINDKASKQRTCKHSNSLHQNVLGHCVHSDPVRPWLRLIVTVGSACTYFWLVAATTNLVDSQCTLFRWNEVRWDEISDVNAVWGDIRFRFANLTPDSDSELWLLRIIIRPIFDVCNRKFR